MKKFWIRKVFMLVIIFIAATLFFSWVVMALWNAILPEVIAVKPISFIQALGILVLSKILFGGFKGGWRDRAEWKQKMKDKCETMTPEQREQFKAEWKNRCGNRWSTKPPMEQVEKSTG